MSGKQISIEDIRKYLRCVVCFELSLETKFLPCFHNICVQCLMQQDGRERDVDSHKLNCYVCNCPYSIVALETKKQNKFLRKVSIVVRVVRSPDALCMICNKEEDPADLPEDAINEETTNLAAKEDSLTSLAPQNAPESSSHIKEFHHGAKFTGGPNKDNPSFATEVTSDAFKFRAQFESAIGPPDILCMISKRGEEDELANTHENSIDPRFDGSEERSEDHENSISNIAAEADLYSTWDSFNDTTPDDNMMVQANDTLGECDADFESLLYGMANLSTPTAPDANESACQSNTAVPIVDDSQYQSQGLIPGTNETHDFQSDRAVSTTDESECPSKPEFPSAEDSECQKMTVPRERKCCTNFCYNCFLDMCRSCAAEHVNTSDSKEHYVWHISEPLNIAEAVRSIYMRTYKCLELHPVSDRMYFYDCDKRFCLTCQKHEGHRQEKISEMKNEREELATHLAQFDEVLEMVDRMRKISLSSETYCAVETSQTASQSQSTRENKGAKQSRTKGKNEQQNMRVKSQLTRNKKGVKTAVRKDKIDSSTPENEFENPLAKTLKPRTKKSNVEHHEDPSGEEHSIRVKRLALLERWRQNKMRFDNVSFLCKTLIQFGQPYTCGASKFETFFRSQLMELLGYLSEQQLSTDTKEPFRRISTEVKFESPLSSPSLLPQRLSVKSKVRGVAVGLDQIFVAQQFLSEIHVFDSNSLQERRSVVLGELKDPWDIIELAGNLYVSERSQAIIHKYDIKSKSSEKWKVYGSSATLSVTPKGNIVTSFLSANRILENTQTGKNTDRFDIKWYIVSPSHAIRIRTDEFVICDVLGDQHRLIKLSRNLNLNREFRRPCQLEMSALKMPQYLIRSGEDYILVADTDNNRILLMDIYLELVKELILPKHDLEKPFRMCLERSSGRLFVAEEKQNKVKIFSFPSTK